MQKQILQEGATTSKLKQFIGFIPYWSVTSGSSVYPNYFTHIMYFGLNIDSKGSIVKSGPEWNALSSSYFMKFISGLDRKKTKLSFVVKQLDGDVINSFISDKDAPMRLVSDLSGLISQFNLDGINFDFEFDGATQSLDRDKLSNFIETVSSNLKKQHADIVLSFDLSGQIIEKEKSFDLEKIGKAMDFVILMGYDYKNASSSFPGPVAPLLGEVNDHTISEAVEFVSGKIPTSKIVLGIPLYGYEWETIDSSYKSSTMGKAGVLASLARVSTLVSKNAIKVLWDEDAQSPWFSYQINGQTHEIYFENEQSLFKKIKFAKDKNLNGAAFWALGYEGDNENLWKKLSSN